jgi:hypothetical protein
MRKCWVVKLREDELKEHCWIERVRGRDKRLGSHIALTLSRLSVMKAGNIARESYDRHRYNPEWGYTDFMLHILAAWNYPELQ